MELALLVYLISLLEPLRNVLLAATIIVGIVAAIWWIMWLVSRDVYNSKEKHLPNKVPRRWTIALVLLALSLALFPSEKTAYFMVGAYATQKIAEAPKTQELGADVLKIIESKIKFYADQSAKELEEKLNKNEVKK